MVYSPWDFEDRLFTARVYKRSYRHLRLQRVRKEEPDPDHDASPPIENEKRLDTHEIHVRRDLDVSTEQVGQNMEHRDGIQASHAFVKLVEACGKGHDDTVKRQLATMPFIRKADPDMPGLLGSYHSNSLYFCPVHAAAMKGNLAMVQLLLENGASVHSETGLGIQAIHLSARIGSIEILATLIEAGADVNCEDRDGWRPLHYLADSQDQPDVIHYLAERGAEINCMSRSTELNPYYLACKSDFRGNMETLLSLGALTDEYLPPQGEPISDATSERGSLYSQSFGEALTNEHLLPQDEPTLDTRSERSSQSSGEAPRDGSPPSQCQSALIEHEAQWHFLEWVKNHRPYDPDISSDELKMCPMLWCRKQFDTKNSTIRHAVNCSYLSNSWYYCPYHKLPEYFLGNISRTDYTAPCQKFRSGPVNRD